MPIDFNSLTTIFSGGQLAVAVFVFLELRNLSTSNKSLTAKSDNQNQQIAKLTSRLSHVMGRLKIEYEED